MNDPYNRPYASPRFQVSPEKIEDDRIQLTKQIREQVKDEPLRSILVSLVNLVGNDIRRRDG